MAITLSSLAAEFGIPLHRARYILQSRGVEPVEKIGTTRIFAESAREVMAKAILGMAARTPRERAETTALEGAAEHRKM